jgi:ATP-binding protein involved in chromosome partitioning
MLDESTVRAALAQVKYPGFSRDILSFGLVKEIMVHEGDVIVNLSLATRDAGIPQKLYEDITQALKDTPGVRSQKVNIEIKEPPQGQVPGGTPPQSVIPGVTHVIAIASGKGGVGKSTVAANLAVALKETGADVGLCDCDLYGPSIAQMFGTDERPLANEQEQIVPISRYGLKLMSMGFLLEDASPVIVRGPMATRYTQQFLRNVDWGHLDYLVLDLPPGTGDIQLTIVQTVALAGTIIVTTPQEVALIDARKAVTMFEKVNVKVLGLIENMSYFLCPSDNKKYFIFGEGGGTREAARLGVPVLGQIPIDIPTREGGDKGEPVAVKPPSESAVSAAFHEIAGKIRATLPVS